MSRLALFRPSTSVGTYLRPIFPHESVDSSPVDRSDANASPPVQIVRIECLPRVRSTRQPLH